MIFLSIRYRLIAILHFSFYLLLLWTPLVLYERIYEKTVEWQHAMTESYTAALTFAFYKDCPQPRLHMQKMS